MLQERSQILWNQKIGSSYYRIGLACREEYSNSKPGQFIMLRLGTQFAPLLRRPFSIHRLFALESRGQGVELLYKVVGECTQMLSQCRKGDWVDILGPLGKGFRVPNHCGRVFIVAGGIGVAPLLFLAESFRHKGLNPLDCLVFLGGRTQQDLLCRNDFSGMGLPVHLATDDGSEGEKGPVTDLFKLAATEMLPDIIYACGPMAMLRSVAQAAQKHSIACQVSIETVMACGMGACLGCAVEQNDRSGKYLHACLDGPVFDAAILSF